MTEKKGPDTFSFRVWAPNRHQVDVVLDTTTHPLTPEGNGYFSGLVSDARAGSLYRYRLDDGEAFPDPASRFQPNGPHGPSMIVDPASFPWTDAGWPGAALAGQVLYELHIGTFTPEGTWTAAERALPELADCGITALEIMPVADFPGRFGWGYDGVNLFAPTRHYGTPDDFRRFVDTAHHYRLAVLLDVVYNHLGPDGNYLSQFSSSYFTRAHATPWGDAFNFDGPHSGPVREFILANAGYWIEEFHLDGLRLDATQTMIDRSPVHILTEIGRRVRTSARGRATIVISENEPQHSSHVRPVESGGFGLDALWNDDFHHSATVALTGRHEAFYTSYTGSASELLAAVKHGCLFQGQHSAWHRQPRGQPGLDLPPAVFVNFLENHDQVACSLRGRRLHQLTSPGKFRALLTLLLLGPGTPMLFMGQEFAASAPFHFFADHEPDLAQQVKAGRAAFLARFPSLGGWCPDPNDLRTFTSSKLDLAERHRHAAEYQFTKDLLKLRQSDPAFHHQKRVDGAVLGEQVFVVRFFHDDSRDRLLIVNLGNELSRDTIAEPLLAPPAGREWQVSFSTDDPRYGGAGRPVEANAIWKIPAESAVVLAPDS